MSTYNLAADGTLTLYGRVFANFADGDISSITFPNEFVNLQTGKNGNTIYTKNEAGRNAMATLRLIRGSSDDQFLQTKFATMKKDFVSTELAFGEFALRLGDGYGNIARDVYTLQGGAITKPVEGKENVSGDASQGVSIYTITFADGDRSIQ